MLQHFYKDGETRHAIPDRQMVSIRDKVHRSSWIPIQFQDAPVPVSKKLSIRPLPQYPVEIREGFRVFARATISAS
ncbi:MAG: hypothetical protein AABY90_00915 [Nitrospirota bacterium]